MSNQGKQLPANVRYGLGRWIPAFLLGGILALNLINPLWGYTVLPPEPVKWISLGSLAIMMVDLWSKVRVSARFP